jgi:hypothetical protein
MLVLPDAKNLDFGAWPCRPLWDELTLSNDRYLRIVLKNPSIDKSG